MVCFNFIFTSTYVCEMSLRVYDGYKTAWDDIECEEKVRILMEPSFTWTTVLELFYFEMFKVETENIV